MDHIMFLFRIAIDWTLIMLFGTVVMTIMFVIVAALIGLAQWAVDVWRGDTR